MDVDAFALQLRSFVRQCNENGKVQRLIRNWSRYVELNCGAATFYLSFLNGPVRIEELQCADRCNIFIQSSMESAYRILQGERDPGSEMISGRLQITASEKDQLIIDAISLILWGW